MLVNQLAYVLIVRLASAGTAVAAALGTGGGAVLPIIAPVLTDLLWGSGGARDSLRLLAHTLPDTDQRNLDALTRTQNRQP